MTERIEVQAERSIPRQAIELFLFAAKGGEISHVGKPVVFEPVEEPWAPKDPTMRLRYEDAQTLMDELWRCGLRPTEGTGSSGSLAATERHLSDMQEIAKGLLRKEGVEL